MESREIYKILHEPPKKKLNIKDLLKILKTMFDIEPLNNWLHNLVKKYQLDTLFLPDNNKTHVDHSHSSSKHI